MTTGALNSAGIRNSGRSAGWREGAISAIALTKPRIVELLLVTTVPTMVLAAQGWPGARLVAATVVGGAMAAGGANALNMVIDRDIDAVMSRTRGRPLVTGAVSPAAATTLAAGLEAGAFPLLWWQANLLSAVLALAAAVFYVGVYTAVLKRSTSENIVIGGAAGATPVLVGWAAVTGHLSPAAWLLFALVVLWTPPHFWALAFQCRDDYRRAGVPMLPAVRSLRRCADRIFAYTAALVAVSLALAPAAGLGPIYLAVASGAGAVFLARSWGLRRKPTPARAIRLFHYSIVYLAAVFVAVGVDTLVRVT